MTLPNTYSLDMAFVPKTAIMFSELIDIIDRDPSLTDIRRRDMISGLRRVAKAINRTPQDVPCHGRWLQPRISNVAHAALGITKKAWQNAVSDVRSAMAHVGIIERRQNRLSDLSPAWQKRWSSLLASDQSRSLQPALCRFVHFLSNRGIAPDKVCPEHAAIYKKALQHNEISKAPEIAQRAAMTSWNLAARSIPNWPQIELPIENRQRIFCLSNDDFPQRFIADLNRLMGQLSHPDPLGDIDRRRALRPSTIDQYRRQIIRFASEVVHSGVPIAEVTTVASLLAPGIVERGLRQMLSRTDDTVTKQISEMAGLLRNLGKVTGQSEATKQHLAKLAQRLARDPQKGMTCKNRERLRVFQDDLSMLRLLRLPEQLFLYPPNGKTNHFTVGLCREDAVAIAILLVCPIRIKNLAGIHLEQHIERPGDGRAYLVLTEEDTKNGRPLEFELPAEVVRMIDRHLAQRSPHMCPPGTPWLFPRRDGKGPVLSSQLADRIKSRIRNAIGFTVNAHLFRHLAVMNWLDAYPGAYEGARRLLGHSEVSHTINMYSGLEVKSATRAFADLIETRKGRRP